MRALKNKNKMIHGMDNFYKIQKYSLINLFDFRLLFFLQELLLHEY